jgi:hypothetical protein
VPIILVIAAGTNDMENRPAKAEMCELSLHGNLSKSCFPGSRRRGGSDAVGNCRFPNTGRTQESANTHGVILQTI